MFWDRTASPRFKFTSYEAEDKGWHLVIRQEVNGYRLLCQAGEGHWRDEGHITSLDAAKARGEEIAKTPAPTK